MGAVGAKVGGVIWIVIPFFSGDVHLAKTLLKWIAQLDIRQSHGALLCCDTAVDWGDASDCLKLASSVFQRVEIISSEEATEGWVVGANTLFKTAAQWFQSRKIGPWLWLEPDAIPLKKGWLDAIQDAYFAAGKPFWGAVMQAVEPNMPSEYLPGVACYPQDCFKRMSLAWRDDKPFDIATASVTVPFAAKTDLIHHFWGERDLPPTFVAERTAGSPRNVLTLDKINPEAVIFHRNKDGTLLQLLGYREMLKEIHIDVVFPFWAGDAKLMLKNLNWMNFLHGRKSATAVLVVDQSASLSVPQMQQAAGAVFSRVVIHLYSALRSGWPSGPNCAFQEACRIMASRSGALGWFWSEPDAIPIVPDWLEQLSAEYEMSGKAFMGTIIGDMGHMNGVAVYPREVFRYCKKLNNLEGAWDTVLNDEIIPHRHMANHLIQHHRGPPSFASKSDLNEVEKGVAVFHPDKTGRLMDRLSEQMLK